MTKLSVAASSTPPEELLDAAERLLVSDGYAAVSTRRLAEEAGLNHGLIHYYFGSMDELFIQVLERFTQRLIGRQRQMYGQPHTPFSEKWRSAVAFLEEDAVSGYQKLWLELQAMAWNRPELAERIAAVNGAWRQVLTEAFTLAADELEIDNEAVPVPALVSLVMTFNQGLILERLSGVTDGHDELLGVIEGWFSSRQRAT